LLLNYGIEEGPASQALQVAINGGPDNIDIIERLLTASPRLLSTAFKYTTSLQDPQKKAPILDALLKMGVPQDALDQALAVEIRQAVTTNDTTSTKLLLGQGASVSHNDGEALSVAVASGNSSLMGLLLSGHHQPSRSSVTRSFRTLFTDDKLSPDENKESIGEMARELLARGVEQSAIDAALRLILSKEHNKYTESLVDMLLQNHVDVNTAEGTCFIFSAQKHSHTIFEKLMRHNPNFNIVVPALLSFKLQDEVVVAAIQSCLDHGCALEQLGVGYNKPPILITAMTVYPRNSALIKLLLDNGLDSDTTIPTVIHSSSGPESVSALLWALAQPQKRISDAVISALLEAGTSVTRVSSVSETTPLMLAAREGRHEIVSTLVVRGCSDADLRDASNRSALFYASSSVSGEATVKILAPHSLGNDGSLHEAARELNVEVTRTLLEHGHDPNYPSRLHGGRNALGELCLNANVSTSAQRSKLRQLLRLLLHKRVNPKFRARNEKSCVILALDNAYSALFMTEALLETEIWQDLNDEAHIYCDPASGLHYSPYSYVELIATPARAPIKKALLDLLRDKACLPVYYSSSALQPVGATGIPPRIAQLVDKQKEHELAIRHEKEKFEHSRTIEETSHKDLLRRKRESQDVELALQTKATQHYTALEQQKHDFEVHRVREAERMKRSERVAWHNLVQEQERNAAAARQSVEERKMREAMAAESKMIEQRKQELEHRAGVERRMLKEKEEHYERNVKRQKEVRQIEGGPPQWGTVD
jgi:hypothetical protein